MPSQMPAGLAAGLKLGSALRAPKRDALRLGTLSPAGWGIRPKEPGSPASMILIDFGDTQYAAYRMPLAPTTQVKNGTYRARVWPAYAGGFRSLLSGWQRQAPACRWLRECDGPSASSADSACRCHPILAKRSRTPTGERPAPWRWALAESPAPKRPEHPDTSTSPYVSGSARSPRTGHWCSRGRV